MHERVRASATLAALSASYVLRRPVSMLVGAPSALRLALVPAAAAWSAALAATGALAALRVGTRVRRAPILRANPTLLARPDDLAPVCTLVSDTHLIAPHRIPVELAHDPSQWPRPMPTSSAIAAALVRVLEHVRAHGAATVFWCGDEVDTGDPAEWRQWREIVDALPGLAHRLVPGNHDICFNRPYDEDYSLARRAVRERAYQQHAGPLADFPIADAIITDAGPATVVLLDSCQLRSRHVLSNAIGRFGDVQLDELARMLAPLRGPLLCVTHHHVWRDERFLRPESWYETAVDSDRLFAILTAYRRRAAGNHVLVCHGHRHALTAGTLGGEISVIGLPSTTLGDKSATGVLDGILRYAIAGLRRDGTWGVAFRQVGAIDL
jgi:calcineurin-like phosphoesterase family protein